MRIRHEVVLTGWVGLDFVGATVDELWQNLTELRKVAPPDAKILYYKEAENVRAVWHENR